MLDTLTAPRAQSESCAPTLGAFPEPTLRHRCCFPPDQATRVTLAVEQVLLGDQAGSLIEKLAYVENMLRDEFRAAQHEALNDYMAMVSQ